MSRLVYTTAIALVLLPLAMDSYANAGTTKPTSSNPTAGLPTYGTTAPLRTSVVKTSQIQNLPAGNDPQYVLLKSPSGPPQIYTRGVRCIRTRRRSRVRSCGENDNVDHRFEAGGNVDHRFEADNEFRPARRYR